MTGISWEFGASGGIERLVAKRLASDGFGVAVNYAGNLAKAEAVVAEIKDADGKANLVRQCKIYGSRI
jgi:3-oxoacyl-[acyl-carrier protein] reductase